MKFLAAKHGQQAEKTALSFLIKKGLVLLEKNYHSRRGEIDIIMLDKQELVFVEVRYRKSDSFGSGLESVDSRKQAKIQATAETYMQQNTKTNYNACRFDVIAMAGDISKPSIEWVEAAF